VNRSIGFPAVLAIAAALAGCASWKRAPHAAPVLEQLKTRPQALRATLSDGTIVSFRSPVIRGDSLLEGDRIHGTGRTVAISQIREVETKDVHDGQTLLIGIGALVGVVLLAFMLTPFSFQ
jgi:hypothetical protein